MATKIIRGLRAYDLKGGAGRASFVQSSGYSVTCWGYRGNRARILEVHSDRTRGNGRKLQQGKFRSDIGKKMFAVRTGKHRSRSAGRLRNLHP